MNVLFDSSCVYAVLNPRLEPTLAEQIPTASKMCKYFTGPYLRMEFLRRWIKTGIEVYFRARLTGSMEETFDWFSHRFSQRENKIVLQWAVRYMKSVAATVKTDNEKESVERFGWEVLSFAFEYDRVFRSYVQVKTGCKRGQIAFDESAPTLREALQEFYSRFNSTDYTCRLDELLNVSNGCPRLRPVTGASTQDIPVKSRRGFKNLCLELQKFLAKGSTPDCNDCHNIGDFLIALEQPPKTILYHVDSSFSAICPLLGHEHKELQSLLASAPGVPDISAA
jgi:hypothetical protein